MLTIIDTFSVIASEKIVDKRSFNTLAVQLIRFFPRRFIARVAGLSVRSRQMPGATQCSAHQ